MTIRELKYEDCEKAAVLLLELDALHVQNRKEIKPEILDLQYRKKHLTDHLLANKNNMALVAEENNEIIGFVSGETRAIGNHLIFRDSVVGQINDLIVRRDYQKRGVGRKLINEMEARLRTMGADHLDLKVYDFNKDAIRFYEQIGFKRKIIVFER